MKEVRNLIVLGNGFDLDLGLHTSFASFVESYHFQALPSISFISNLRSNNWSDVEASIRMSLMDYCQHPDGELAKAINSAWQALEHAWGRFLPSQIERGKIHINKDSCAFSLLSNIQVQAQWYSFNYTHPRYLCGLEGDEPVCIHNDCVEHDDAKENGLMYYVPTNLIIGVDSTVPENIANNAYLRPIIKKRNSRYQTTDFVDKMYACNTLVLFGHALGMTDADYFRGFFADCINDVCRGKTIYIVTRNKNSLKEIEGHLRSYEVDFDNLVRSDNSIIPVFTQDGTTSPAFETMMTNLGNTL